MAKKIKRSKNKKRIWIWIWICLIIFLLVSVSVLVYYWPFVVEQTFVNDVAHIGIGGGFGGGPV